MSFLRAMRALARFELRQLLRHPGRSALVVFLIAVPVAGMVGGGALMKMTQPTAEERRASVMGAADCVVRIGADADRASVVETLGASARTAGLRSGFEGALTGARELGARTIALEAGSLEPGGVAEGFMRVVAGDAPRGADQVALSRVLLDGLGLSIGQPVTLAGGTRRVVGEVLAPEELNASLVLRELLPDDEPDALLVELGAGAPSPEDLRAAGLQVQARSELGGDDPFVALVIFVVGGFALFEAALVIAAAFSVSVRRRLRSLGLLASTGATSRQLRLSMLFGTAVLALVGSLVGLAVGSAAARVLAPHLDGWNARINGGFEHSWPHVVGALLLGLLTAELAVAWPTVQATRLPVRVALGGRRPLPPGSRRWLVVGVALVVLGVALTVLGVSVGGTAVGAFMLGGAIAAGLGLGALSPWMLEHLAKLAGRLPLAWRLAVRDAGRFRARNGPVVCAVLACLSISVVIASMVRSVEYYAEQVPGQLRTDQLLLVGPGAGALAESLVGELPVLASAPLLGSTIPGGNQRQWIAIGEEPLLVALAGEAGRDAFESGHLLQFGDARLDAKTASIPTRTIAVTEPVIRQEFLLRADAARDLELEPRPLFGDDLAAWLVRLEHPVKEAELDLVTERAGEFSGTTVSAELLSIAPAHDFLRLVLALCLATGLLVILIATSLSSVEAAADSKSLVTVGAPPGLLARHLAARASYLAVLGGLLAIPVGVLPAWALTSLANVPLVFHFPWPTAVALCAGLPAITWAVTWTWGKRLRPPNLQTVDAT